MLSSQSLIRSLAVCALLVPLTRNTSAATLTVDPAQSKITLAGTAAGYQLREQGPGSLTTTIGGTIDVNATGTEIQIISAGLDPNVNGNWAPGRNNDAASPADLAGSAPTLFGTVSGALRDLLVTASSGPKPLAADGSFDAGAIVFAFPPNSSSVFEYDSFATGKGSKVLSSVGTNQTATAGTWAAGTQTLTIALNATFYFTLLVENDTQLTLTGEIVAKPAGPAGPMLGGFQIVDGKVQFSLSGGSESSGIESSTNLVQWTAVQATATSGQNGNRDFSLPASGPMTFYRAKQ
jgi:hypothetical protein